ncbi:MULTISPECIES: hypothetical protein [unclassified Mesorhizobium]|uniref:hypothetical protein n=1 Tax=unclassified Mesorhizobium TaxID=325217 RepID=UPI000FDBA7EB|nr:MULTISPECIES: hypothetical protein [unclassified Mesorhizobium]AZV19403.1 hypothetical protein EJ079_10180 [Mesorhizobium sp. M7A.F.Ce.TU.012.03.2.1]MDF3156623.1 hypothetical protein [Mesorhizobium sp. XAP10]MDF3249514.1 hypothetical protein [Mesorhizobium sp. XAP4]TIM39111.1 MAG: hypothetical protein E5Y55_32005 [Mesorhizobium sp.]
MIRRSRKEPEKLAYYLVFAPEGTALAELAGAAGLGCAVEECFARAKDDLGPDHCEARSWHGWHRHMGLVGRSRLTIMTALLPSVPEIRYLLARLLLRPPTSASFIIA